MAWRSRLSKLPSVLPTSLFAARPASNAAYSRSLPSPLRRLCPFFALSESDRSPIVGAGLRCFSTLLTPPSQNDSPIDWRNILSEETIPGCDFEHWFVLMKRPEPNLTRDEIIDSYIKTLAQVVGSEEEARMKIYSVSTKYFFAFGALVSEELLPKIKALPKVQCVIPDIYIDVINKDYGGEPFVDGQAVPYDPKYHSDCITNTTNPKKRGRQRQVAHNLSRRRENMKNVNNTDAPPMSSEVPPIYSSKSLMIPYRDYQGWDMLGRDQ